MHKIAETEHKKKPSKTARLRFGRKTKISLLAVPQELR